MTEPFSLTEAQQDEYLSHLRNGLRRGAAAYAMELTRIEVVDYIEADEAFRHRVEDAEAEAHEHVEESIFQAAVSGSVSAARLWMTMRGKKSSQTVDMALEGAGDEDDLEAMFRLTQD